VIFSDRWFAFRVGDVWTSRICHDEPFTITRLDDRGNVFAKYSADYGLTTRVEFLGRYRPVRVVGRARRLALRIVRALGG
jgi:hypothetical protein